MPMFLLTFAVTVLSIVTAVSPGDLYNAALDQATSQSSNGSESLGSELAVKEQTTLNSGQTRYCATTTEDDKNAWWLVEFDHSVDIVAINISTSLEYPLGDFLVEVGCFLNSSFCVEPCFQTNETVPAGDMIRVECETNAQYVRIKLAPESSHVPLSLCEVTVYDRSLKPLSILTTSQSSTASLMFPSSLAVDGNDNNQHQERGICSSTKESYSPWWKVDLGSEKQIEGITITDSRTCCEAGIQHFLKVFVGRPCAANTFQVCYDTPTVHPRDASPFIIEFTNATFGQYVKIKLEGQGQLTLCEVQVWVREETVAETIEGTTLDETATTEGTTLDETATTDASADAASSSADILVTDAANATESASTTTPVNRTLTSTYTTTVQSNVISGHATSDRSNLTASTGEGLSTEDDSEITSVTTPSSPGDVNLDPSTLLMTINISTEPDTAPTTLGEQLLGFTLSPTLPQWSPGHPGVTSPQDNIQITDSEDHQTSVTTMLDSNGPLEPTELQTPSPASIEMSPTGDLQEQGSSASIFLYTTFTSDTEQPSQIFTTQIRSVVVTCTCYCKSSDPSVSGLSFVDPLDLLLNRRNVSKFKRRFYSVYDDRPSAISLGSTGILCLVFVFGLFVLSDVDFVCRDKRSHKNVENQRQKKLEIQD